MLSLNAFLSEVNICSGCVTSAVDFVNNLTISARSVRPFAISLMSLLPAVTIIGVRLSFALCKRLMPFARPVSICRFTIEDFFVERAYQSAIPIATPS